MSEENKVLTQRFYDEVFNAKHLEVLDELLEPDFVDHTPMPGQAPGRDGLKESFRGMLAAFPDVHVTVEHLVADGDTVVARFAIHATHQGSLMGEEPTGRGVSFQGMDMIRIRDGKATDVWHYGDEMAAFAELGIIAPAPASPAP